ncbi:hypothetical protein [Anaerolentibacter hominis]|uniref:V-type ATP synthase subunit E n=1 Tax=Anaerolentibacter hominis TaxID=3079009 RepID=UPI0031B82ADE
MENFDKETERKLALFEQEIMNAVQEQTDQIDQELETYKTYETRKREEDALNEAYHLLQTQLQEEKATSEREVSREKAALRKQLYERRDTLITELFQDAALRLKDFTKEEAYQAYLMEKVEKLKKETGGRRGTLQLRPEDLELKDAILKAWDLVSIEANPEIEIGGMIYKGENGHYLANETLDEALRDQKAWLAQNSGFVVTMGTEK